MLLSLKPCRLQSPQHGQVLKIVSVDTLLSAESFDKYDLIMSELS